MTYKIDKVTWHKHARDIKTIREKVFVYEYRIPETVEFDNCDTDSDHVLLRDNNNNPIATGRLCKDGRINRVAVLLPHRKPEITQKILTSLLDIAKAKGFQRVLIDSNLADVENYQCRGFKKAGTVYMDAGVAKQPLVCPIDQFSCIESVLH